MLVLVRTVLGAVRWRSEVAWICRFQLTLFFLFLFFFFLPIAHTPCMPLLHIVATVTVGEKKSQKMAKRRCLICCFGSGEENMPVVIAV